MSNKGQDNLPDWNVLTSPWLQVLDVRTESKFCSPLEALGQAENIHSIALPSPLDFFATHRFLLTLLYWKANEAGGVNNVRQSLLKGELPKAVLEAIEAEAEKFSLFHDDHPFLQDCKLSTAKKDKSIGSMFAEFASGTNIAHFHHSDDKRMRLCLQCTTVGLLRVIPWSQSGGRGLTPSVHNAPPIMAIASGKNLAITLGLNFICLDGNEGVAKWSGHFKPSNKDQKILFLEAFTWNPRRIYLSEPEDGNCWGCGQRDVATIGPIAFQKNENTKPKKQSNKTIPFKWQDPAAFYPSSNETELKDENYKTSKSTKENLATTGRDLQALRGKENGPPPESNVVRNNPSHDEWHLIVPCTNPANNKTFDHRKLELSNFTPDTIKALSPTQPPFQQQGFDGWSEPKNDPRKGVRTFVTAASKLLTHADWIALSNAAYREMREAPAAFDVLTGLYWGLRNAGIHGLPSQNVAWLILKLMAAVPHKNRVGHRTPTFCPIQFLPKRQLNEQGNTAQSLYPVSFPLGRSLEAVLRRSLGKNTQKRKPERIDWARLCSVLESFIN